jgi:O-antigen ligase
VILGGGLVFLLSGMVAEEFARGSVTSHRLQRSWDEGDTAGRTEIWEYARNMIKERPLLGYGGVNNYYELGLRLNFDMNGFYYRDTHNLLYAVLTEVGLIGGVPFLGAMLYALWIAWRYGRRCDDGVPFALMCVLYVMNASITGYHQKIFWVVVAAAAACGMERGGEQEAPDPALLESMGGAADVL